MSDSVLKQVDPPKEHVLFEGMARVYDKTEADEYIEALRAEIAKLTLLSDSQLANQERLAKEVEKLKSRRVHTQEWYASHYAKLEDWARKILPEPWRNQFFSCVANGTYSHSDVGEAYICKAGFKVVPSGYIHMDDAKGQIIRDQTTRAEDAEAELATERANQERLVGEMQELRQVVKEYRYLPRKISHRETCRFRKYPDWIAPQDDRCQTCIKADALLAKDTPTEPKSAPEEQI